MVESLKGKQTLKTAELQDGDIICFQRVHEKRSRLPTLGEKQPSEDAYAALGSQLSRSAADTCYSTKSDRFEDAREYYDFLLNRRAVLFHAHPQKCDAETYPPFELVLNTKINYDRLSEKVAEKLEVPATHLRFYTVNASSNNPRTAVKRGQNQTLYSILHPVGYGSLNMNQRSDALFFEVLDMSLAELDTKKSIKITLLSEGITKEVSNMETHIP